MLPYFEPRPKIASLSDESVMEILNVTLEEIDQSLKPGERQTSEHFILDLKMQQPSESTWKVCDRFLELRSHWMTLIGEHLQEPQGQILEYWRVEKADSVIILPIQNSQILLPTPSYRPGLGQTTLDFPGGRVSQGQSPHEAALMALKRELGIEAKALVQLTPLNTEGWAVNSSFSNQKLYSFIAEIKLASPLPPESGVWSYPANSIGVGNLLQSLTCLQCRAVLLEWWLGQPQTLT